MASSSHPGSRRFHEYLQCLQEAFEHQSNETSTKNSGSRRFNVYLGNLKGEFELMSLEIETLREERDEYKEKVKIHMKDLQRNLVCERCSVETTSGPRIPIPPKPKTMKTTRSLFSTPFFQFKFLDKQGTLKGVDLTQATIPRRPTQHTSLIQKLHSIFAPRTRPSQSVAHAVTDCSNTTSAVSQSVSHTVTDCSNATSAISQSVCHAVMDCSGTTSAISQTIAFPSPLPQASTSAVGPNAERDCLIKFNNEVEKRFGVEIAHTLCHGKTIWCTKFSRDGNYLAAGCEDGKAYIYNVQAGTLKCVLRNLLADKDRIRSVCFNHDGKYLVTGTGDGGLFVWKINTKYVRNAFKGHTKPITSLDFSPNGRLLLSASSDNTVRLWNMRDGATKCLTEKNPTFLDNSHYTCAVFSPDGGYVAASHRDGVVRIWSVHTGHLTTRIDKGCAYCVAFMPDGKGLVSGGWDSKLRYWPLDSTRFRARPQTEDSHRRASGEEQTCPWQELVGHKRIVYCIATSPDGGWIASGSIDRSVRIWDTRSAATHCIINHGDFIWTVDFSPGGGYLASGGGDGILRIWRYLDVGSGDRYVNLCDWLSSSPVSFFLPSCPTSPPIRVPVIPLFTSPSYTFSRKE